jgi:hypothetical protein
MDLTDIIRVIISRMMRWVGHVACMGAMIDANKTFINKPEGTRPLKRPESGLGLGLVASCCKHSSEPWVPEKARSILTC